MKRDVEVIKKLIKLAKESGMTDEQKNELQELIVKKTVPVKSINPIARVRLSWSADVSVYKLKDKHVASCPFHKEHTPSLAIYPDNNRFYCFSCEAEGEFEFIEFEFIEKDGEVDLSLVDMSTVLNDEEKEIVKDLMFISKKRKLTSDEAGILSELQVEQVLSRNE